MKILTFRSALPLALLILPACPVPETVGDNPTETTTQPGTTLDPTTTQTAPSTSMGTEGTSSSTTEPTVTSTTEGSDTTGQECSPPPMLEACPVTQCIEGWGYQCPSCNPFMGSRETCFEIDVGCTYPALTCDLSEPCQEVRGVGDTSIASFVSDDAAICMLTALRDGTPGKYEVVWGANDDAGWVEMTVYSGGQDVVLLEWYFNCPGCPDSGEFRRSGQLALQPDVFFDDCLVAPDTASLIQCVFGFVDFTASTLPSDGYTPPWTTGECVSLEIACPS